MSYETILVNVYNLWSSSEQTIELVIPFLLLSFIVFCGLGPSGIFAPRARALIGVIMGAGLVAPHVLGRYDPCWDPVIVINSALFTLGTLFIGIIAFLFVLSFVGFTGNFDRFNVLIAVALIGVVLYTFFTYSNNPSCPQFDSSIVPYLVVGGIALGVLGLFFYFIFRTRTPAGP